MLDGRMMTRSFTGRSQESASRRKSRKARRQHYDKIFSWRLRQRYARSFYDRGRSRTEESFHDQGGNQMRGNIACKLYLNQSIFPTENAAHAGISIFHPTLLFTAECVALSKPLESGKEYKREEELLVHFHPVSISILCLRSDRHFTVCIDCSLLIKASVTL
jgi:hypothetical protein